MWSWFTFWLLLHILIAIAAFGPTFALGFISSYARRDPRNALVVSEILHGIQTKITLPAATVMPFVGLALIYTAHVDLWKSEWLVISIILYVIAYFFAALVQDRNTLKLVNVLNTMPAPPAGGPAPVAGGASGPPPEVAALGKKLAMGGALLSVLLTAIIVLMVWKPGAAFTP